jgi:hypothetical protein
MKGAATRPACVQGAEFLPRNDNQATRSACAAQKFPKNILKKASDGFRGIKGDPITSSNGEGPQGLSNRQWRLQGG